MCPEPRRWRRDFVPSLIWNRLGAWYLAACDTDAAGAIAEPVGLMQTSDTALIETVVDGVLAANADKVEQYKSGREALFRIFAGQTRKAMGGRPNPKMVNKVIRAKVG